MAEKQTPTQAEKDPKIEAIKEIIFGENIKEINQEFKVTKAALQAQKEAFDQHLTQLQKEAKESSEALRKDLEAQILGLKNELTVSLQKLKADAADRTSLGKMLEEIGKKLQE
jgi:transketolase